MFAELLLAWGPEKKEDANAGDMGSIVGKWHGQRSLASGLHSPWGHKESDMT